MREFAIALRIRQGADEAPQIGEGSLYRALQDGTERVD
jgi:hypothetical protein